jgi:hypothetical protein
MSIEAYKMPLIELHRKLVFLLSEKNQEILEAYDTTNRTNNLSLIDNRKRDLEWYRNRIDDVAQGVDFMPGFLKDFESIKTEIEKIKP